MGNASCNCNTAGDKDQLDLQDQDGKTRMATEKNPQNNITGKAVKEANEKLSQG